jgi:hypothetical protein
MRWRMILAGGAVLLMLVLQLRQPGAAYACSCGNPSLEDEFDWADAVFQGEVVVIERLNQYEANVTFDVSKGWKGSYKTMIIRQGAAGSCSYYGFVKGREYIVFASDDWSRNSPGTLDASICGSTDEVSERMLAELKLLQPELQPLSEPGSFNPDNFIKVGFAVLVAGGITAFLWCWRRALRPI